MSFSACVPSLQPRAEIQWKTKTYCNMAATASQVNDSTAIQIVATWMDSKYSSKSSFVKSEIKKIHVLTVLLFQVNRIKMLITRIVHYRILTCLGWQCFFFPVDLQFEEFHFTEQNQDVDGQLHQQNHDGVQRRHPCWKKQPTVKKSMRLLRISHDEYLCGTDRTHRLNGSASKWQI